MDGSIGTLDIVTGMREEVGDDSQDDELEGDEERQRELKDILSTAFEDMSSIDDEDEENSAEFRSIDGRHVGHSHNVRKKFFSTPNNESSHVLRPRQLANISVIEEEPNSIHSGTSSVQKESVDLTSVEKVREADQHNDSYHIRLLLDQNKKLGSERTKLKQLCDNVTGDFEGVSYKCQRLEEVLSEKEKLVEQLVGQMNGLKVSLQAAKEAQSETSNKLVIAESTISSLRNELKEMHQADGIERIRVLYDAQLKQLQNKFQTERSVWSDEKDSLNEKIDEQKHQISKLRIELDLRAKKAAAERRSPGQSEGKVKKLESEIAGLKQSNAQLVVTVAQYQSSSQESQGQVKAAKLALSEKCQETEQLTRELEAKDHQIQILDSEIKKLNQEIKCMSDSLTLTEQRLSETRERDQSAERKLKSRLDQELIRQVKEYRDEIEDKFRAELTTQVQEIRAAYDRQQERLNHCVLKICGWIEGLSGQGVKPQENELFEVFDPVVKIWLAVENKMDEQLAKLLEKKQEIEDAKRELEQAYADSKSDVHEEEDPLLQTLHQELNSAKDEISALKDKVSKYKKNYTLQVKKFASEREQVKRDYAALIRSQVADVCRDRESQLMNLLTRDSRQLLQQINQAYADSLRTMKEQHDRFFEESNGRSLRKMGDAIVAYHEIVTKKNYSAFSSAGASDQ